MATLLACVVGLWHAASAAAAEHALLIRVSPLAGSQFYALSDAWSRLQVGDWLQLIREPGNRHDANAIRVEWQGQQLGYLPRAHNPPLAAAMDRGLKLIARIRRLTEHPDPWQRVELEVYARL